MFPFVLFIKMAHMAGSADNESQLIEKSLSGDPEAYAMLVDQYRIMIQAVVFRMTGSYQDAEELTQDAFLRGYHELGSFKRDSKFSSWLYRIAVNLSLDWRRRENRRESIRQHWAEEALSDKDSDVVFPDEFSHRLQESLKYLPAKQRAAIVLTAYENQTHAEAAKTLGCTEATISWRLFAARRKLKRILERNFP